MLEETRHRKLENSLLIFKSWFSIINFSGRGEVRKGSNGIDAGVGVGVSVCGAGGGVGGEGKGEGVGGGDERSRVGVVVGVREGEDVHEDEDTHEDEVAHKDKDEDYNNEVAVDVEE